MIAAFMSLASWPAVAGVLSRHVLDPSRPIRPEDRLVEDLGLDSLALARTVVALEAELGTELPPDRLHELRDGTAADLARLLDEALAA
jgi:acyl carrier protein